MRLTSKEKSIIKEWFQYVSKDSQHYGNGAVLFPLEAGLLKKLSNENQDTEFNDSEIELIKDWMDLNIKRQYGDAKFLMGDELSLYKKLKEI